MKAGTRSLISLSLCAAVTLLIATLTTQAAGKATIQTDLADYPPNTQVNVTGSGWLSGETVELTFTETATTPPGGVLDAPAVFYAAADAAGNIANGEFHTDQHDLGVHFLLTAKGTISGRWAQTTFTDDLPGLFQIDKDATGGTATSHDWNQVYTDKTGSTSQAAGTGSLQFTVDGVNSASDDTFSNSPKDTLDINTWKWGRKAVSAPKTDLEHGFAAAYQQSGYTTYGSVHTLLYVGTDRFASGSNSAISIWFLQHPIGVCPATPAAAYCTNANSGTFVNKATGLAEIHEVGDLLIQASLGSTATVTAYQWVGGASPLSPISLGSTQAINAINTGTISVPWSFTDSSNSSSPLAQEFFEVGLDLNEVFKATADNLPDFSSFIITSRTSTSQTATLSDFILGNVSSAPDVAVTKTADAATVSAGDQVGYTVSVSNAGVGNLTGITLNDPLPAGAGNDLNWTLASNPGGIFQITGSAGSQSLSFTSPQSLAFNAPALVAHIVATSTSSDLGKLTNTAAVTASGEASDFLFNNTSKADIVVVPVAVADGYSTALNTTLTVTAAGVRSNDGTPLSDFTSELVSSTSHGTLTFNADGSFTYTPNTGSTATDAFTYRDKDVFGNYSNTVTVTITIGNHAPVANDDAYSVNEDATLNGSSVLANDTDADLNSLTVATPRPITGPSHGSLTLNANGTFTYTPTANYNGSDSFTYQATDGAANSSTATVTITVYPTNDQPVANPQNVTTDEDTATLITLTGDDGDTGVTQTLTFAIASNPSHGSLSGFNAATGAVTYTPDPDYNGADSFTFTVTDDALAGPSPMTSGPATVSITVNPMNDAPANVSANNATLNENGVYNLTGSFTDLESGNHTVTISWGDGSANTVVNLLSGVNSFASSHQYLDDNPTATASDNYAVTVTVTDNSGAEGYGGATVTVNNVAPVVAMSTGTIAINLGDTFSRPGSFSDVGTLDTWSATVDYGDGNGEQVLALTPGKTFSLTSPAYTAGSYTVTVKVTDDDGGVGTKSFQVLVDSTLECLVPQNP